MTLNAPSVLEMTLRNLATKETLLRRTMDLSADDERAGLAGNPALQRRAESCPHYPVRGPGTGPEQGRAARASRGVPEHLGRDAEPEEEAGVLIVRPGVLQRGGRFGARPGACRWHAQAVAVGDGCGAGAMHVLPILSAAASTQGSKPAPDLS